MSRVLRFLTTTTIGQKLVMGVTGLLLIGFLVMHMAGNLLVFAGAEAYNDYSHKLVTNPLIYAAEIGLLVLFVGHFVSGIRVWARNRAARPVGYTVQHRAGHTSHKSLASTTMIVTGVVLLTFVPLHLWTFKFGAHYPSAGDAAVRDIYRLVIEDFQNPLIVAWYVLAMGVVGFHLWHGFGSGFESLGVSYRRGLRVFGQALAIVVAGGFVLVPIMVLLTGGKL